MRQFIASVMLLCIVGMVVGCQQRHAGVIIDEAVPPPFNWQVIHTVAVLEFEGDEPWPYAGRYISDSLEDRLARQSPYFVMPRHIADERLNNAGYTQPEVLNELTVSEIGRLLEVDAVIVGRINLSDHRITPIWPNNQAPANPDDEDVLPRRYDVTAACVVTVRVVHTESDNLLYQEQYVGRHETQLSPLAYVSATEQLYYRPAIDLIIRDFRELYPYAHKDPRLVELQLQQPRPTMLAR